MSHILLLIWLGNRLDHTLALFPAHTMAIQSSSSVVDMHLVHDAPGVYKFIKDVCSAQERASLREVANKQF